MGLYIPDPRVGEQAIGRTFACLPIARIPEVSQPMPPAVFGHGILADTFVLHLDLPNDRVAFVRR